MTELSVVIPVLDAETTIAALLDALMEQDYEGPWEIVVADNGSGDRTREIVESYGGRRPPVVLVDASERRGPSHARNVGAAAASGDALVFVDADDVVSRGWLGAVVRALETHDFVASRMETELLNEPWARQARRTALPGERLTYSPYVEHAGGSGMAVRRNLFSAVGGFDESLPLAQDTDLCIRLQLEGAVLHHARDAVVHYRFRTSLGDIYRQGRAYAWDNAVLQARYSGGRYPARDWCKWPLRHWKAMAGAAIRAYRRGGRARLAWVTGWQVGRLRASLRFRVPAT